MWRGRVLNELPEVHDLSLPITPLDDDETKTARGNLTASVHTVIMRELDSRKKYWLKKKKQALNNGRDI
jgi:hypothetical protein